MSSLFFIKVLLILIILVAVEIYFFKKLVKSTHYLFSTVSLKRIKIWKNIIALWINLLPLFAIIFLIYSLIAGIKGFVTPQSTIFDYLIQYPFWIGAIIIAQVILIFLIFKISLFTISMFYKDKVKLEKIEAVIFIVLLAVFIIYVPARIIYDYNSVEVRRVVYQKENLPDILDGFKIALISDTQADRYTDQKRLNNFIKKVNDIKPDLVLIGGDIITGSPDYIKTGANYLGKINAEYGVFSCVGDHDNWAYRSDMKRSLREVEHAMLNAGVPMIDDENRIIKVDSAKIKVSFVKNTYMDKAPNGILDTLAFDSTKYDLKIFLVHQPRRRLINFAQKHKYDLYLCGHTHGGQMTFIFPFYNLSPTQIETPYMRGNYQFGNMLMIVTRGLGMSITPIRYNSTPEITEIVLRKK